jgi:stage V sporulation protein SpoVS
VIVNLSEAASNAMLDVLTGLMDGGSIELHSVAGNVLAVLRLSNPAAADAVGGAIELNQIAEEDAALARGQAATARILALDGNEILNCDVTDESGDGVIRLNTTSIYRGGPVRIRSFTLAMP